MRTRHFLRTVAKETRLPIFRLGNRNKKRFQCPICNYYGPFADVSPPTGLRKHAECPRCGSLERHRLQYLVLQSVLRGLNPSQLKMLHFAPEAFFRKFFAARFGTYETADLNMKGVDHKSDLQHLQFPDSTYDFVFASHVLEHIRNDTRAIKEIRRVLRPGGIAIIPVPLVAVRTIEYPAPNPYEGDHVRAPGLDYFDRCSPYFSRIDRFTSDLLPEKYQLFVYEDRTKWPTLECPLRLAMQGERHVDLVPVCYA
jgi:SAM-dependent methyltransferase